MLTQENIGAINEFIRRWNAGERGYTGWHLAGERLFALGLRKIGVNVVSGTWSTLSKEEKDARMKKAQSAITPDGRKRQGEKMKAMWAAAKAMQRQAAE